MRFLKVGRADYQIIAHGHCLDAKAQVVGMAQVRAEPLRRARSAG